MENYKNNESFVFNFDDFDNIDSSDDEDFFIFDNVECDDENGESEHLFERVLENVPEVNPRKRRRRAHSNEDNGENDIEIISDSRLPMPIDPTSFLST